LQHVITEFDSAIEFNYLRWTVMQVEILPVPKTFSLLQYVITEFDSAIEFNYLRWTVMRVEILPVPKTF